MLLLLPLLFSPPAPASDAPGDEAAAPWTYGDAFWSHWGDGRAEVATYDLGIERYGRERAGTAVAIFVTETFSESERVKADPGRHPEPDTFPALKLNLVKDFPTGLYDYNVMLSDFVALAPVAGRPAGAETKISFSAQEWCGHVYHQLLFDRDRVRQSFHSYFDGEADGGSPIDGRRNGLSEDTLLLWARGLAGPAVEPGASVEVPLLLSLQTARFRHRPVAWLEARLSRDAEPETLEVPAGRFACDVLHARVTDGGERSWTFHVERTAPRRLVRWRSTGGESGELVASRRVKYWQLNAPEGRERLEELGLSPRPRRTP